MQTPAQLLREIRGIRKMERGTLCRMRRGLHRDFYNHQTWTKGRNVVRYVPRERVADLREAIAGYRRFLKLTQAYADLIIDQTRSEQPGLSTRPK